MLKYNGQSVKFCDHSVIADRNPKWIAQTRADKAGSTIQIWEVDGEYYMTIALDLLLLHKAIR